MKILESLLKEVPKNDIDTELKQICDKIMDEESPKFKLSPVTGPNIFLAIEVDNKKIDFICLERESKGVFFISYWYRGKRRDVHSIEYKSRESSKKILMYFAEKLSYLRGE